MNIKKTAKLSAISLAMIASYHAQADQVIQDDSIVVGSICIGLDCVNGENFGFDTIRLKENNVRIRAVDSSSTSSFPNADWQLTFNESSNGGLNKFSIEQTDSNKIPFTIIGQAPNNSLFISQSGNVGMGTTTPLLDLEIQSGNSPSIRLSQDGSAGFTAQAWDVGGNETSFFIRDVSNGSTLPFRIAPNAPNSSIHVAADGDVGFSTNTPDGQFDVAHAANANNHAFFIDPSSNVGVNIDNGFLPSGLFDVQTTGGVSRFNVANSGSVGIGAIDAKVYGVDTTLSIKSAANLHNLVQIDTTDSTVTSQFIYSSAGTPVWTTSSRNEFSDSGATPNRLALYNKDTSEVFTIHQNGGIYIGKSPLTNNNVDITNTIQVANGAALTAAGVWTNASSRALKENITDLSAEEATKTLNSLEPVTYNYLITPEEQYVGFIAEDVPSLVATNDRKGLSPMDVVAVLTKVLQQQQKQIEKLEKLIK